LFEKGRTCVVFAGYCSKEKRLRAFRLETDNLNNVSFEEIIKEPDEVLIFGSGKACAESLLKGCSSLTDRIIINALKQVIDDPNVESVGGNIQFGSFDHNKFRPAGVAQLGTEGVHYWRGPLDLNGPAFDQENGLISNFPLLDLLSVDET
jgi:hypothetical protein